MQCFPVGYHGICHASLVFSVYEENTSDKWHIPRYPTRKHCITTLSHAQIFRKLMQILGRARKSPWISEKFGNASNPFLRRLNDLWNILENFGNSSKVFSRCFYDFLKFSKVFRNLRKFSEKIGNGSKVIFRCFSKFLKFSGNLRKSSENIVTWSKMFVMVRRSWRVSDLAFEKSSNGPQ